MVIINIINLHYEKQQNKFVLFFFLHGRRLLQAQEHGMKFLRV